jgi:hypothetical protein
MYIDAAVTTEAQVIFLIPLFRSLFVGILLFVRLLMKKQVEVICLQKD